MILCKAIMLPVEIVIFIHFWRERKKKRSGRTTCTATAERCRNLPGCKTGGFTLDALEALGAMKHLLSKILSFLHIKPLSANPSPPRSVVALINTPCLEVPMQNLGPSVASVMMMAARTSEALKDISLTLKGETLAHGIPEHWGRFEISNERARRDAAPLFCRGSGFLQLRDRKENNNTTHRSDFTGLHAALFKQISRVLIVALVAMHWRYLPLNKLG